MRILIGRRVLKSFAIILAIALGVNAYLILLNKSSIITIAQEIDSSKIHLYPALEGYPEISIADLQLGIILFLAQGETISTIPHWKENVEVVYSQIKVFMESQFNNQIKLTYTIFPEPIQGEKTGENYTFWDFPVETMAKNQEIDRWFHSSSGYRILIIYAKGQIRGANESPAGYGVSVPGRTVVNPGFWLEDLLISGNNKYGIIRDGIIGSAHELGHALGIPHPWDMPENVNNDPNFGNISGNIMGYSNSHLELSQTYFEDIVKQRMGLETSTQSPTVTTTPTNPTSTLSPTKLPTPTPRFPDATGDNIVNDSDLKVLIEQFGNQDTSLSADFNTDQLVNLLDFEILRQAWGKNSH